MTAAEEWMCPFENDGAQQLHHQTGKDHRGVYFDRDLVVPLCIDHHVSEHQIWDRTGVGEQIVADQFWLRLRRAGQFLVRLGEYHGAGVVVLPAPYVRELGLLLIRLADEILRLLGGAP